MFLSLLLAATVVVGEREFPTYPYSDPNPVPAPEKYYWPYVRHDGTTDDVVTQKWRTVTLESDRLKVTMLPDVGGKVWGAVDKLTGREFIYFNHAVKFRDIAMCGPWCSGGIEFNFGVFGHSPTTAAPVKWAVRENSDGSVSYFCGDSEKICGTTWQVEVQLKDGEDFFTTKSQWFNSSELDEPYYQWMTAAYTARGNPELEYPGTHWISHGGKAYSWPFDNMGRNLSVYGENAFGDSKSYHIVGGDERFFGIWWPEAGFGSYHENDHGEKYGRKIFMWALSRSGGIWEDLLTDTDGQYIELQSGRVFNQPDKTTWKTPFKHPTFTPGRTDVFVHEDTDNQKKWGLLQFYKKVDENLNDAQIDQLCAAYLTYYNKVDQSIKLESMGQTGLRAGMMIPVLIEDIEDLSFNRLLLVEKVTHKYEGSGAHTMSIELKNFEQLGGAAAVV
jgi:hypothetical protein